jgi:hypothetical protein
MSNNSFYSSPSNSDYDTLVTRPYNPLITQNSKWAVLYLNEKGKQIIFNYTITNGWQRKHSSIEESASWQFGIAMDKIISVTRY